MGKRNQQKRGKKSPRAEAKPKVKSRISMATTQFYVSIVVAVLFGILGAASVIPFVLMVVLLIATLLSIIVAFWHFDWPAHFTRLKRVVIAGILVVLYSALAAPAVSQRYQSAYAAPSFPFVRPLFYDPEAIETMEPFPQA